MYRSRLFPIAVAVVFVAGATGIGCAATREHENGDEIAAVLGANTSAIQAIAAAQQQVGGQALRIDVEEEDGSYLYEVTTVSKDQVTKSFVDLASGQVVGHNEPGFFASLFDPEDSDEFARLTALSTNLAEAIATAENQVGGKAVEARLEGEGSRTRFMIEIAKGSDLQKVTIDAASGRVVKVKVDDGDEQEED